MPLNQHNNRYRSSENYEANMDEWMLTYGDMITLLMCFFLVLISISQVDVALFEQIKSGLRSEIHKTEEVKTPLAEIKKDLDSLLEQEKSTDQVSIELGNKGIVMEFASSAFYQPGQAELGPRAGKMMHKVSEAIGNIPYYPFKIDIEGHTDDVPINTTRFPSNWELSASRASNIVKFLIEQGIQPERLKAAGYADTKPVAPNLDESGAPVEENRAKNRRIVLRIH